MANAAEQMARNMNFRSFAKAKDLQSRILFTLGILILYRLGTFIPLPGLDPQQYAQFFESQSDGLLGNMNMFAGGAVERRDVQGVVGRTSGGIERDHRVDDGFLVDHLT